MDIASMVPTQMTLGPDEQTVIRKPDGSKVAGKLKLTKDGQATAPVAGPVVLDFPVVLPKTAVITGCRVTVKANVPVSIRIGDKVLKKVAAKAKQELEFTGEPFAAGTDFVITEVAFCDFMQVELNVLANAPASETAKVSFTAEIDYRIPVESASAYLNYIMTQA